MAKTLRMNIGNATLLHCDAKAYEGYDSININAGNLIASTKAYEILLSKGASINCGNTTLLDISGEITEIAGNTIITEDAHFDGCFIVCDGNLVVQDIRGLKNVAGLYARTLFVPLGVDMSEVRGLKVSSLVAYPIEAKLSFGDITIDESFEIGLERDEQYWIHGKITALELEPLERIRKKNTTFHCKSLRIRRSLYETYRNLIDADHYLFLPDDHEVVGDINLDAATSSLYGDKLFVMGDLMIEPDQAQQLTGFTSLIVNGTATMPVTAASAFRRVGKASDFSLYEGTLLNINGFQTLGHEQLQSALREGTSYTITVHGALYFFGDVTSEDMKAIAAVSCNGFMSAPDHVRGALDAKIKGMNGTILDIDAMIKKVYGKELFEMEDPIAFIKETIEKINGGPDGTSINVGNFKG